MQGVSRLGRWAALALLASTAMLFGGCRQADEPTAPQESAERAEVALRELGRPVFDVVSFRIVGSETAYLPDFFRYGTSLYLVHFNADIRYPDDFVAPSRQEMMTRLREPDSTTREIERDITLARLLGDGRHAAGSSEELNGSVVFEETESGWRLVAVDHRLHLARH